MTERDHDSDATLKMPQVIPKVDESLEEVDPEATLAREDLAREDWESTVIRRVAPHVTAVQSAMAEDPAAESRYGWESQGLRRLAHEVQKAGR